MELNELLEKVNGRESFIVFVKALIQDREKSVEMDRQNPEKYKWVGALGWENGSIENYLNACIACFEDDKRHQEKPEEITWKRFAEFLHSGKIYE